MEQGADLPSYILPAGIAVLRRSPLLGQRAEQLAARRPDGVDLSYARSPPAPLVYAGRDDADLINLLSAIEGAIVSMIFVEQTTEKY